MLFLTVGRTSHQTIKRSLIQRNKLGHSHNRIKVEPIMTTGPRKDVGIVIAVNTTPLNNCLLNMVATTNAVYVLSNYCT